MSNIDPAELSAFIDGELSPRRAAEVNEQLQRDPELRAELERLRSLDDSCRAMATSASFTPEISLPPRRASLPAAVSMTLGLLALLVLRCLYVTLDAFVVMTVLHAIALGVILVWLVAKAETGLREPMTGEPARSKA